jgi:hypothetical protein
MSTKSISQLTEVGILSGEELVEISQLSTIVNITGTTISADGDDNSYNDSGGGFLTAGFLSGMRVFVEGFTGNVANNIFVGIITALTANKMTIGGADGNVIVDDAAGESVSIYKWESFRTTIQEIADLYTPSGDVEVVSIIVTDPNGAALTTGDGKAYFRVPSTLNGKNLIDASASVSTVSSSGLPTVQLRRKRSGTDVDMLTTKITIDASERDSGSAAAAEAIDTANDDVATGDQIYIDVDVAGTGAKGLVVEMQFQ